MQTKGCQDYYPDLPCGVGDCSAAGCGCDGCGNNPELSYTEEEKEIAEEWATGGSEFGLAQRLAKYRMKLLAAHTAKVKTEATHRAMLELISSEETDGILGIEDVAYNQGVEDAMAAILGEDEP